MKQFEDLYNDGWFIFEPSLLQEQAKIYLGQEIENAKFAFEKLKSKVIYIHKYELINELGSRYLIEIKKKMIKNYYIKK